MALCISGDNVNFCAALQTEENGNFRDETRHKQEGKGYLASFLMTVCRLRYECDLSCSKWYAFIS